MLIKVKPKKNGKRGSTSVGLKAVFSLDPLGTPVIFILNSSLSLNKYLLGTYFDTSISTEVHPNMGTFCRSLKSKAFNFPLFYHVYKPPLMSDPLTNEQYVAKSHKVTMLTPFGSKPAIFLSVSLFSKIHMCFE